jgi:hypothetical protein
VTDRPIHQSKAGKAFAALFGLASLLLAVAVVPAALVAPMGLDLQASALNRGVAYMLLGSPLLLLAGAVAAIFAFRRPTRARLIGMLLPFLAVAVAAALAAAR